MMDDRLREIQPGWTVNDNGVHDAIVTAVREDGVIARHTDRSKGEHEEFIPWAQIRWFRAPDRLREIEERLAKASPGPWYPRATDDDMFMNARYVSTKPGPEGLFIHDGGRGMDPRECDAGSVVAITLLQSPRLADVADEKWEENADFIAHSREDIPWLIQQLRAVREENQRLRDGLVRIKRHSNSYLGWAAAKGGECFQVVAKPGVIARAALEEQP